MWSFGLSIKPCKDTRKYQQKIRKTDVTNTLYKTSNVYVQIIKYDIYTQLKQNKADIKDGIAAEKCELMLNVSFNNLYMMMRL